MTVKIPFRGLTTDEQGLVSEMGGQWVKSGKPYRMSWPRVLAQCAVVLAYDSYDASFLVTLKRHGYISHIERGVLGVYITPTEEGIEKQANWIIEQMEGV